MKYSDYVHKNCIFQSIPEDGIMGMLGSNRTIIAEESRYLIKSLEGVSVKSSLGVGRIESVCEEIGSVLVRFDDDQTKFYDSVDLDLELLGELPKVPSP